MITVKGVYVVSNTFLFCLLGFDWFRDQIAFSRELGRLDGSLY